VQTLKAKTEDIEYMAQEEEGKEDEEQTAK